MQNLVLVPPPMNSEQLILCLAARTQIAPEVEQQLLNLVRDTLDWELLWGQGHLHEVLPLLATTMRRLATQVAIPQPWLARAQRRLYATMIRNTTLADTLIEVLAAFQPADLPAARAALRELRFAQEANPGFENAHHPFHDPPYYRPAIGGDICLELHRGLWATRFFRLGTDTLWARSGTTRLHGGEVRVLSPEDTLLHLTIHRSRSALRLRFVCDIAELLRRHAEALDWDYVLAQARAAGARTALFYALTLAQELSGAPLPPGILPRLGVGQLKRRLLEHTCGVSALFRPAAADDFSQQPSLMLRMFEQEGLGHIAWNIGANLARKTRKYVYNYRHAQKTGSA